MRMLCLLVGLMFALPARADGLIDVSDLSVSYRQYTSQSPNPGSISYNTPPITLSPLLTIPSQNISIPLPQVNYLSDVRLDLKVNIFTYFYYKGNLDTLIMNAQFEGLSGNIPLAMLTNGVGIQYKGLSVEYDVQTGLVNNVYLNTFFPPANSIVIQYNFIKNK